MNVEETEVLIIGAGAAGLTSAYAFLRAGCTVTCIEQGKLERNLVSIQDGGELEKWGRLSTSPERVGGFTGYKIDCTDSDIEPALFHAIGGSTFIFSAQYPRFHKEDFKTFTYDGVGDDWPIEYDDLTPYYELNERLTGVAGCIGDPMYPEWKGDLMPPVTLGKLGEELKLGFERLGWHHWPAYAAINTVPNNGRPADDFARPSNLGDTTGAKGSADNAYLEICLQLGLRILTEKKVVTLNERGGRIKDVVYVDSSGRKTRLAAKLVVLACGGLGTPRLLLSSVSGGQPAGIGNNKDLVGRYLMMHPLGYAEGYFEKDLQSNVGAQGCCLMSQEFYKTREELKFKRGYTLQTLRGPLPIEGALNLYRRGLLELGQDFWSSLNKYYNHSAHITVICEDLPESGNRVELDHRTRDCIGMAGLKITYGISHNTKRMLSHGVDSARRVLKESGAYKTFGFGPVRATGWHILGTCRMGVDPNNSVVDPGGYVHGIENLLIVDGSVFTTSSGVNPASTIQALSLYLSSNAAARL